MTKTIYEPVELEYRRTIAGMVVG